MWHLTSNLISTFHICLSSWLNRSESLKGRFNELPSSLEIHCSITLYSSLGRGFHSKCCLFVKHHHIDVLFLHCFFLFLLFSRQPAIGFLIETGTLLHFPDTSHGLCTLYFLCPVWLSECLERIVHLKSSRYIARNGVIQTEDLRVRLAFLLFCVLKLVFWSNIYCGICCADAFGRNRVHTADRGTVFPISGQVWDCPACGQQQVISSLSLFAVVTHYRS